MNARLIRFLKREIDQDLWQPYQYPDDPDQWPLTQLLAQQLLRNTQLINQHLRTVQGLLRQMGAAVEELGDLAGLDRTYVGGIERGERNVSAVNIAKIARALKIKPEKLLVE